MSLPHICICEKCRRKMGGVIPLVDPVKLLQGNLKLAEEGLANYAQEVEQLRALLTQAPIAKVTVRESGAGRYAPDDVYVSLYAPGLPPGEHDVYLMPEVPSSGTPEETMADDVPTAVWSGTIRLFGIDVRCHRLDDGRAIIETESMQKLLHAMASGEVEPGDIESFARFQAGHPVA